MSKTKHTKKQTAQRHLVPTQIRLWESREDARPWYTETFPTQLEATAFLKEYANRKKSPEKCIAWLRTRPYGTFFSETTEKPI